MLSSLKYAPDRKTRFEFIGKVIPGFSGLLFLVVVLSSSPIIGCLMAVLAFLNLILGRAIYELFMFSVLGVKDETDNKEAEPDSSA